MESVPSVLTGLLLTLLPIGASVTDTKGHSVVPVGDPKSAGSVLIFVIDGCPIARSYSPEINRLESKFAAKKVKFFLVFSEKGLSNASVNTLTKDFALRPPAIIEHTLAKSAGVKAVPTAILYDNKGKIRYQGRIDDRFPALGAQRKPRRADLEIAIKQFLAGKPITIPKTTVVGCVLPNYSDNSTVTYV